MASYYNEIDPFAAEWLRELIKAKVIPDGTVDSRSIEDVRPVDLRGFTQCHFFAGIGGWAEALRLASWPADRPVWTGSCPCQSFSTAGAGRGFDDERHLWPAWFYLVEQCRPTEVFGEQVDGAIRHGWLDLVQTDFQGADYAFASAVLPAAGVGAPHGRHRLVYVAKSEGEQPYRRWTPRDGRPELTNRSADCSMANSSGTGLERRGSSVSSQQQPNGQAVPCVPSGSMANSDPQRFDTASGAELHNEKHNVESCGIDGSARAMVNGASEQERISRFSRERRTAGFWANADWIPCRDGKWRPIEPGVFPLAHGVSRRMDKLRGFGNAIVPQVAAAFIQAYMSI